MQNSLECHLFLARSLNIFTAQRSISFFLARSVKVGVFARGCKQMAKNTGDIEAVHMDMELM